MSLTDLPMLDMLRAKMKWHQARQQVLSENIANADTPGYRAQDLRPLSFAELLEGRAAALAPVRTDASHLGGAVRSAGAAHATIEEGDHETTPSGNAVVLEEQMMKVTANQLDYQAATTLYAKSIGLLRLALGQGGH